MHWRTCGDLGFGVWGLGVEVWGLGFEVWGLGFSFSASLIEIALEHCSARVLQQAPAVVQVVHGKQHLRGGVGGWGFKV